RLAHWIRGSVINAGDGTHEHPTQALLDAYTMRDRLGRVEGLNVAIVGDVLHSRVARSNVLLLSTLGADVTVIAPPTLLPGGVEIAAEVADSVRSTIVEQVANGVSVRMAVLYLLLGGALIESAEAAA